MIYPFESDLEPVIYGEQFDALLQDNQWQIDEIARCSQEPWYFIVNYCWTIRRDAEGSYVERVPAKDYLRQILDDLIRNPYYALTKSRQLMATWLTMCFLLWWSMYNDHSHICCQQKKEDDADTEMIQRADHIWRNLPVWFRKAFPAKYSFCKLSFKDSIIRGIPQGADQIRSHNPNILFSDEIAFQEEAEGAYTAALPCCQRIILVSTAGPGFFCDLVHDRITI